MHPFLRKVFSGYTHFEEKFSLDTPIYKKSFLWMHPFWLYMGDLKTVPQIPQQQQQQEEEQHLPLPDLSASPQIKKEGKGERKKWRKTTHWKRFLGAGDR